MLTSVLESGNVAMNKIDKISSPHRIYFPVLYTQFIRVQVFSLCFLALKCLIPQQTSQ